MNLRTLDSPLSKNAATVLTMAQQVLELDRLILVADGEISSYNGINRVSSSLQADVDDVSSRADLNRWLRINEERLNAKTTAFVMIFDPEIVEISPSGSEFGILLQYPRIGTTRSADISTALRSIKIGLFDFIEKPFSLEQIRNSLEQAFREYEITASINKQFFNLTKREIETCELVVLGHSNKEISEKLDISVKTVKVHRANLMRKIDAKSVTDLLRLHDAYKLNTQFGVVGLAHTSPAKTISKQRSNVTVALQKPLA